MTRCWQSPTLSRRTDSSTRPCTCGALDPMASLQPTPIISILSGLPRKPSAVTRTDYYRDPNAPRANSLVPGASAIVTDDEGNVLLHRRRDSGRWALPGGIMDIGETIAQCAEREVKEETGLAVTAYHLVGVYSDPDHVF